MGSSNVRAEEEEDEGEEDEDADEDPATPAGPAVAVAVTVAAVRVAAGASTAADEAVCENVCGVHGELRRRRLISWGNWIFFSSTMRWMQEKGGWGKRWGPEE